MTRITFFLCHPDADTNTARFEKLSAQKEEIEALFGEPLDWDFSDARKQQYIRTICPLGGLGDEDMWQEIQNDMVARLVKLEKAIGPHVKAL